MSKRNRHPKGGRTTPKGTRPPTRRPAEWDRRDDEPDLMSDVLTRMRSDSPLDLLAHVGMLMTLVDKREYGFGKRDGEPPYALDQLVEMFLDTWRIETSALLAVIVELAADATIDPGPIRLELARRNDRLPVWLRHLADAEVHTVEELVHVLGDGDNIHLGVRFAGGEELTVVVYIDHNMGTIVKDAFIVPAPITEVADVYVRHAPDPDTELRPLDPADARERITDAVWHGSIVVPPIETETWPVSRPIVEWLTRLLPGGGRGYERPEWSDEDRAALIEQFVSSPFGQAFDDDDDRALIDSLVWFGADYGPGDPLRWSPVSVEIVLVDWFPRKIVDDVERLARLPDVLRAFIRYCHAERGIREALTAETLEAVDTWEPEYRELIASDRPQGVDALYAAMAELEPDSAPARRERMLAELRHAAGGQAALLALDDAPLPDEPFDWSVVPDAVRERTTAILEQVDEASVELFDVEHRTAARRLLARAIAGDADRALHSQAKLPNTAAAVVWTVAQDNDSFTKYSSFGDGPQVKDLLDRFGIGSVSQRAAGIMSAAGFEPTTAVDGIRLGVPELLVSRRRRELIQLRARYLGEV